MLQRMAITALINFGCWKLAAWFIRRSRALRNYESIDCWKLRLILMTLEPGSCDALRFRIILIGTSVVQVDKNEWSAFMNRWIWFLVLRGKIAHALQLDTTTKQNSTSVLETASPFHPVYYWLWI